MAATERKLRMELPFAAYALTLFISAKTGQRVGKILPAVNLIAANNSMRVSTSRLNEVLREALLINPPPGGKGRAIKIYYGAQTAIRPPSFVLFANEPELIHFSYIRYIENKIRESFDFSGTPIRIILRKRTKENDIV
jgi:GTP-binding protein